MARLLRSAFLRLPHVTCFLFAVIVAFLSPSVRTMGTETATDRWVTAGALFVAGVLFVWAKVSVPRALAACAVLVAGAVYSHASVIVWFLLVPVFLLIVLQFVHAPFRRALQERDIPQIPSDEEEVATDIVESIATAFILALVVREFAFEAFKIPTGSMQPTIWGDQSPRAGQSLFADAGRAAQFKPPEPGRRGDRLLAAKMPLLFGDPARWSVIVFRYPLFRQTNYIKRLVGLPGEHLQNKDGDIYIDGKVISKPEEVQETLWFPVVPYEGGEWPGGIEQAFTATGGEWRYEADGVTGTVPGPQPEWLVRDTAGTNAGADIRASFDVDPSGLPDGAAVLVRIDGGGRRVELEAQRGGMWLTAPGAAKRDLGVGGLGTSASRLGFAVADRVVRVYRDGRLVARIETADETNIPSREKQTWIGVRGGTARLTGIRLEHDLQYASSGSNEWQIPAGCYFMLGDNTVSSNDSRKWQGNVFRAKDGREFVAESFVRLDDDERQITNIKDLGEAYDFHDSYGIHRRIAKADLEGGTYKQEAAPFVKREDIVGRAFFIFFPFPPFGDWRPRILP